MWRKPLTPQFFGASQAPVQGSAGASRILPHGGAGNVEDRPLWSARSSGRPASGKLPQTPSSARGFCAGYFGIDTDFNARGDGTPKARLLMEPAQDSKALLGKESRRKARSSAEGGPEQDDKAVFAPVALQGTGMLLHSMTPRHSEAMPQGPDLAAAQDAPRTPSYRPQSQALSSGASIDGAGTGPGNLASSAALAPPELSSMAAKIADRYANPLGKLKLTQKDWRRKHDNLLKRRRKEILAAAGIENEHDPRLKGGVLNQPAQEPLPEMMRRNTLAAGALGIPAMGFPGFGSGAKAKRMGGNSDPSDGLPFPGMAATTGASGSAASAATASVAAAAAGGDGDGQQAWRRKSGDAATQVPGMLSAAADAAGVDATQAGVSSCGATDATGPAVAQTPGLEDHEAMGASPHGGKQPKRTPTGTSAVSAWVGSNWGVHKRPLRSVTKAVGTFDCVVSMAKKHNWAVDEVRLKLKEFESLDRSHDGLLSREEFEQVVRKRCNLPDSAPVPHQLLAPMWKLANQDKNDMVDFEEFLLWSQGTAYVEEVLVPNPSERRLRQVARDNDLVLLDVERIKVVFDQFDADGSGYIDEEEFKHVLIMLMKVKNPADVSEKKLKRYWREIDSDSSGEVNFEEFVLWYFRCFDPNKV